MNELAAAQSLNVAWAFGVLFAILFTLFGVIYRLEQKKHDRHESRLLKLEETRVTTETLDRVERTWRDAIDAMSDQRKEMHRESKEQMQEIKDSITGIHRRIDTILQKPPTV